MPGRGAGRRGRRSPDHTDGSAIADSKAEYLHVLHISALSVQQAVGYLFLRREKNPFPAGTTGWFPGFSGNIIVNDIF